MAGNQQFTVVKGNPTADEVEDRIHHHLAHGHPPDQALRGDQPAGVEHPVRRLVQRARGRDQDRALGGAVGIVDVDLQQEAVIVRGLGLGVGHCIGTMNSESLQAIAQVLVAEAMVKGIEDHRRVWQALRK